MKKVTKVFFCLAIWATLVCSINAQNAAKNWVFGYGARIDFNSTPPTVLTAPPLSADYGSASISDSSGNLLFYTNGEFVWNKNNNLMPNGFGLLGTGAPTQPALIVPCSCGKYFIFTTGSHDNNYKNGLRYSIVDMSLDGGNGDVTGVKNIPLISRVAEKIAGVSDGNGGFWVVAHNMGDDRFFSYHILAGSNCTLIGPTPMPPVISFAGQSFVGAAYAFGPGQMKISPNGKRLAVAGFNNPGASFLELLRFDTNTGKVSNLTAPVWSDDDFYGVEFSPDSKSLYATNHGYVNKLLRYNISADTLPMPSLINDFGAGYALTSSIQLGPDENLYIARIDKTYVNVLPNPNAPGAWTDVRLNLAPPAKSSYGMPAMIAGDFSCGQQGCCDQVKQTPFWTPDLSLSWKAFQVFNVKYPASNICSIDIDIRNGSGQQPPNPWNGGGLKVNGATLAVPDWWRSPYTRIPNGSLHNTVIAAAPNFSAAAVNFNLGLDYSGTYTGKVKLIFRHCDGTTCEYLSDNWTPEPPTQLAMSSSERYLGDLRGEFLPLALGFSDGVNIKSKAAWIAVEPLDPDTEVFSVDGDRMPEIEHSADRQQQLVITSARKQERSALYELARPVDLERFTGGEIKLVLKRSAGNSLKPRLRFLFFDENANMIGYATNESSK